MVISSLSLLLAAVTTVLSHAGNGAPPADLHIRLNFAGTGEPGANNMVPYSGSSGAAAVSKVTWELPPSISKQTFYIVNITKDDGRTRTNTRTPVFTSGKVTSTDQTCSVPINAAAGFAPASKYFVSVIAGGAYSSTRTNTSADILFGGKGEEGEEGGMEGGMEGEENADTVVTSLPQPFFTSLGAWDATPMWSPPCPGGDGDAPEFAYFYSTLSVPQDADHEVESALAFVTAEGPLTIPPFGCCGESEQGSKLLGAYKLFINGDVIGVGPGRNECPAIAQGDCDRKVPYDGYDLTAIVKKRQQQQQQQEEEDEQEEKEEEEEERLSKSNTNAHANARTSSDVIIDIHGYGQDQPTINVTQRVLFQIVVRYASGKTTTLGSGKGWLAFDATSVYNPSGISGGAFGAGYWSVFFFCMCVVCIFILCIISQEVLFSYFFPVSLSLFLHSS